MYYAPSLPLPANFSVMIASAQELIPVSGHAYYLAQNEAVWKVLNDCVSQHEQVFLSFFSPNLNLLAFIYGKPNMTYPAFPPQILPMFPFTNPTVSYMIISIVILY